MPSAPVNKKIEDRLKTIDASVSMMVGMIDNRPEGLLNVNIFILNNVKDDLQKALHHIREAQRQLTYWEAKRGGRPFGFIPDRKRGSYG